MADVEMKDSTAAAPELKKGEEEPSDNYYGK